MTPRRRSSSGPRSWARNRHGMNGYKPANSAAPIDAARIAPGLTEEGAIESKRNDAPPNRETRRAASTKNWIPTAR